VLMCYLYNLVCFELDIALLSLIKIFGGTKNQRHFDANIKSHVKRYCANLTSNMTRCEGFYVHPYCRYKTTPFMPIILVNHNLELCVAIISRLKVLFSI
jgi:hypothetical protein